MCSFYEMSNLTFHFRRQKEMPIFSLYQYPTAFSTEIRHDVLFQHPCLSVLELAAACNATSKEDLFNLGTAVDYVILAKSSITDANPSIITGDIAISPIAAASMTSFAFAMNSTGKFAKTDQVNGFVFAND